MAKNPRIIDLTGQRFGRWLVISQAGNAPHGGAMWLCRCDCGNEGRPNGGDLRQGKSISCGCFAAEWQRRPKTHGFSRTRIHRIWKAMRTRCNNPNVPGFKHYGGRGIKVCSEWDSFVIFRDWALANGYAAHLSIERKNVNGDYAPDNCTLATAREQSINRRFVLRSPGGEAWSQIAKRSGIGVVLMHGRVHEGWPIELAATLPKGSRWRDHVTNP
jgi:hypothetical protein